MGMKTYPVSQELFQALLNHYWKAKDSNAPEGIAIFPKGYCISYKNLIDAAGVPLNPLNAGGPLYEIASFCWSEYRVPIHALVVNAKTGYPGGGQDDMEKGYWGAPGSSNDVTGWAEIDVPSCIRGSDRLPRRAPKLPSLH
jgi:hypothetical protein